MKQKLFFAFCAMSFAGLLNADGRELKNLSGAWDFSYESGDVVSVTVPHTWNAKDAADGPREGKKHSALSVQGDGYKRGVGLYMREIPVKPKDGKRYFLRFEGVSIVADVDVNDQPVGRHEGAFGAFCFEITGALNKNKNTLLVKADNKFREHILPLSGDFSMFGGLYRPVWLIETDAVCIKPTFYASPGVFITQDEVSAESAKVKVKTLLSARESKAKKATVTVTISDAKGKVVASGNNTIDIVVGDEMEDEQNFTIKSPTLWQGRENPYLYTVKVTMTTDDGQKDEVTQPLGLRTVAIDPQKGFILNGKAMMMKGVCRHQDMEGKGWALSPQDEENDIKMMLDMGAEALRTAHYPQSQNIYDQCNKSGLIVWTEVPAAERISDTPEFIANMNQQAREMVYQLGNNPSICMWGLFNEIYHHYDKRMDGVNVTEVLSNLNALIKHMDPSRPTVAATNQVNRVELNKVPENIAYNIYPGWYGGGPSGMGGTIDSFSKKYSGQGTSISEYGHGGSIYHHENPAKHPKTDGYWHPEQWQAIGHEGNYEQIKKRSNMWGTYIWNMFDFATDARIEGERAGMNDKGLITYDRKVKKDAYYFYKANWNPELMVYITSRRFIQRSQPEVPVKVYSNADQVELAVNGRVIGGKVKPDDVKRVIWEKVQLKPGKNTITVKATRDGKSVKDSCVWTYKAPKEPVERDEYDALKAKK